LEARPTNEQGAYYKPNLKEALIFMKLGRTDASLKAPKQNLIQPKEFMNLLQTLRDSQRMDA